MLFKETYRLWERFGNDCEIHRFYMDVCDFLRKFRFNNYDEMSSYLEVSIDSVKGWSCGRRLPSSDNAVKLIILFKEVAHGNCYECWKSTRKNHFNLNT